ncbi:radical SAM protein [Desulfovibrio gilichinskyi]|uniref:Radical SAM additional 4Fe4S-binding SPASM domain-containing protein n=1 Tax=Desulfovibrio gilichinskyi TaxID=1519643 RepID=A0A1X7EAN2_9BACT|nr:radical SAM protein [Desulfovibrio gilichinskyi]SMF30548.1 radical SAM additional 4Fe4S-binding SPASM domain-containing protein [Desulfovibrio gilichinskyi]
MKYRKQPIEAIPTQARIAIYGAGRLGAMLKGYLEKSQRGNSIPFFIDSFKNGEFEGINVVNVNDVGLLKDKYDLIVIASQFSNEIIETLCKLDIKKFIALDDHYFLNFVLSNEEFNSFQRKLLVDNNYLPSIMLLQISALCNLKCTMCAHEKWRSSSGFMEDRIFFKTLEQCKINGVHELHFYGPRGEPLLHPKALDYIKVASNEGFRVTLITNGTLLTEDKINSLLDSGVSEIGLSFSGHNKESYESVYVGAKFEETIASIRSLKSKISKMKTPPLFSVKGVLTSDSLDDLNLSRKFLRNLSLSPDEFVVEIAKNWRGAVELGVFHPRRNFYTLMPIDDSQVRFCEFVRRWVVYVDGDVAPCGCLNYDKTLKLGNIEEDSLADLATSKIHIDIIDSLCSGNIDANTLCQKCDFPYRVPYGYMRP